jgi:hypothetical protein
VTREEQLEAFFQACCEHFFTDEAGELEYSDFLDKAEEHGLVAQEPYDSKKHGEDLLGDPDPGDMVYIIVKKGP